MKRFGKFLLMTLVIAVTSLIITFIVSYYLLSGGLEHIVYQEIKVDRPTDGDGLTKGKYDFYWLEITNNKNFDIEVTNRIYGEERFANLPPNSSIAPPNFTAGVFKERLTGYRNNLGLKMWRRSLFKVVPEEELLRHFSAGREVFLERIKERGVQAELIGNPKIIYPFKKIYWGDSIGVWLSFVLPSALVASFLVFVLFKRKVKM